MFYKIDYKGKYFTIQDHVFDGEDHLVDDIVIGEITKEECLESDFVKLHKEICKHYGIPPYIGDDKELKRVYD